MQGLVHGCVPVSSQLSNTGPNETSAWPSKAVSCTTQHGSNLHWWESRHKKAVIRLRDSHDQVKL